MITGEEVSAITVAAGAQGGTNAYNWTVASASNNYYYFSNTGYVIGTKTSGTGSTTLSWLVENTKAVTASGATANAYGNKNSGYWTLSTNASDSYYAWGVNNSGYLNNSRVINDNIFGVRPVITIPKSIFE